MYQVQYKKGAKHTVPDALSRPVGAVTDLAENDLGYRQTLIQGTLD